MDHALPPGIYFGLPEDVYHGDPAFGSSDIREIIKDPETWWKSSKRNPNIAERQQYAFKSPATVLGSALHKYVLEGEAEFEKRYMRRPDDPPNATPSAKTKTTKEHNEAAALANMIPLHGDEWDLCLRSGDLIKAHPDLRDALDGGMNEVSVFWQGPHGLMLKCRFDRLKPQGIGDLKTIENEYKIELERACRQDIERRRYDIQADHYLEGRNQMRELVRMGKVFIGGPTGLMQAIFSTSPIAQQAIELARYCAETQTFQRSASSGYIEWEDEDPDTSVDAPWRFAFQFIFIQKSRPGIWSGAMTPGNPDLATARMHIDAALDNIAKLLKSTPRGQPIKPQWRVREIQLNWGIR